MNFVMNCLWHYGDNSRLIDKFTSIIDTGAFAGDYFVGFKLSFMNVVKNAFARSNPHQMITVLAVCIL